MDLNCLAYNKLLSQRLIHTWIHPSVINPLLSWNSKIASSSFVVQVSLVPIWFGIIKDVTNNWLSFCAYNKRLAHRYHCGICAQTNFPLSIPHVSTLFFVLKRASARNLAWMSNGIFRTRSLVLPKVTISYSVRIISPLRAPFLFFHHVLYFTWSVKWVR